MTTNYEGMVEKTHSDICVFKDKFSSISVLYGDRLCLYNRDQFNSLLWFMCNIIQLPVEMVEYILDFTEFRKDNIGEYGLSKYTNYMRYTSGTRSGRVVSKPLRFYQQDFVKGSGANSDRFDEGYYHGKFYDEENIEEYEDNMDGFIVDDDTHSEPELESEESDFEESEESDFEEYM
jgi:hypothetical protein